MRSIWFSIVPIVAFSMAGSMAGCASSTNGTGAPQEGVTIQRLAGAQFRLVAHGSGFAREVGVSDEVLLRAAEQTVDSGMDWFRIASTEQTPTSGYTADYRETTSRSADGDTHSFSTTYNPRVQPGQTLIIQMGVGPVPSDGHAAAVIVQRAGSTR